ncbi:MAG: flagellar export chaperone FliS [Hydrogenophilales bacterium]|nr:flagellar export chaperone FliS [Hydrogenophilales bacterium]
MTDVTNRALSAYANIDLETAVNSASPLQLILLLYDGAIGALATARGQMQDMKFAEKGRLISKAIGIIEGLRAVLDFDKGGEISKNLSDLYEYMKHRLTIANLKNDPEGPAEVIRLLNDLRTAWAKLDESERANAVAEMAKVNQKQAARDTLSLRA